MSAIAISAPVQYQLVNRKAGHVGDLAIVGTYTFASACHVEASFNGGAYQRIATLSSGTGAAYSGTLTNQAQGQGTLTVRFEEDHATTASVSTIGIGLKYYLGGQSNMAGQYTNADAWSSVDGLTAVMYTTGNAWAVLADPISADTTIGSFALSLATLLMNTHHVPVAMIPAPPSAGKSWGDWQKPGALYSAMSTRMTAAGTEAGTLLLVWDGESDAVNNESTATVHGYIAQFVADVYADHAAPTMFCNLQNCPAITPDARTGLVRAAITQAWSDVTHALTGPDFSDLTANTAGGGDNAYHFITDAIRTNTIAPRWATALEVVQGSPSSSPSPSVSPSLSPSSSPSASVSPSASRSPSSSASPSVSPSVSPSLSPSSSPSPSPSAGNSPSASASASVSPSVSPSVSSSVSASMSSSISSSASRSPSPSPALPEATPDVTVICA
jgi:hypothetical protein